MVTHGGLSSHIATGVGGDTVWTQHSQEVSVEQAYVTPRKPLVGTQKFHVDKSEREEITVDSSMELPRGLGVTWSLMRDDGKHESTVKQGAINSLKVAPTTVYMEPGDYSVVVTITAEQGYAPPSEATSLDIPAIRFTEVGS